MFFYFRFKIVQQWHFGYFGLKHANLGNLTPNQDKFQYF